MFGFSFGNGLTLVSFEQESPRLFQASDNLDCRYIRAYFKQEGTPTTQYIQPILSTIYDCAEDLLALGNETIAFNVTPANYQLCKQLTATLKELDSQTRILWFGSTAAANSDFILETTEADGCVIWQPEQALHAWIQAEPEEWSLIEGIAVHGQESGHHQHSAGVQETVNSEAAALDHLPSPWKDTAAKGSQIPVLRCADPYGIPAENNGIRVHSLERFAEDLELSIQASKQIMPCLMIEGFELNLDQSIMDDILQILASSKDRASYAVKLHINDLNMNVLTQLRASGVRHIQVILSEALNSWTLDEETLHLLSEWKREDQHTAFSLLLTSEGLKYEDSLLKLLTAWIDHELLTSREVKGQVKLAERLELPPSVAKLLADEDVGLPDVALMNGFMAYMTGYYPQGVIGSGVKHLGVTGAGLPEESISRLGEYTALNSAFLYEQYQVNKQDNNELFYDTDGTIKQSNTSFDQYVQNAANSNYYLSNAHQLQSQGGGQFELQMNDFYYSEPVALSKLNYAQAVDEAAPGRDGLEFLEIASEEDLDIFLKDVSTFTQTGTFQYGYEVRSYLIDSCRWSGAHLCRAKQLPRMFVDEEANVSACNGCSAIGKVGDSLDSLLQQAIVISDEEQLLRGCMSCEIKDSCSKCSFLPAYMNRQQYCDIRKKHTMLHRYMQLVQLFKGLKKHTAAFKDAKIQEVRVSLPTCTHLLPAAVPATGRGRVTEAVFLFFIQGVPMIYQAGSQRIMKLNEPMAFILEGLIRGVEDLDLRAALSARYNVLPEYAESAMTQAMELFAREGCLLTPARAS